MRRTGTAVNHGPKHPPTSSRADHAELAFAARVAELGWIWHPVLAGRDVGIDGRVELVSDGSVTSDEFTVQIKSNLDVTTSGKARIAGAKLSSFAYWHRKLPPTLLVALNPDTRQCAFEWAHAAIGRGTVIDRIEAGQKTVSVMLSPPFSVDDPEPWQEIEKYVRQYFWSVRASVQRTSVRGVVIVLLLHVCDVIDLLVDWTCWIAYSDPANVVDRFVDRSDADYQEAALSFERLRIWPGADADWQGSIAEPVWAIGALAAIHGGFLKGARTEGAVMDVLVDDGFLEFSALEMQRFLESAHVRMMTQVQALPSGRVSAMGYAPAIGYGVGLVLIALRDWARILRDLLFEIPDDASVAIRRPGGNMARLHELASTAIRPCPAWLTAAERPLGPAWDRGPE